MLSLLLLQLAAPAAAPAPPPAQETLALARRLAETGTLSALLPMLADKETDALVAAHPGLTAVEQADLRRAAAMTLAVGADRLFAAEARALAERLTPEELRALIAFEETSAAAHRRAALPAAIAAATVALEGFDLKREAWAAYCATPGRRC